MLVQSAICTSCGAPVKVTNDIEIVECAFCGVSLEVQRGEGVISLKLAEKVSKQIEDVGIQTQSTIKESALNTQVELKRIQLSQQLSAAQIQLASVRSEIRSLERQRKDKRVKKQLKELSEEELALNSQIRTLTSAQNSLIQQQNQIGPSKSTEIYVSSKDWSLTLVLAVFFGFLGAHNFYTGHWKIGIVQLFTLGGVGIWWIIDILRISSLKFKDSKGFLLLKPNYTLGKSVTNGTIIFVIILIFISVIGISPDIGIVISCLFSLIALGITYFLLGRQDKQPKVS